MHVHSQSDIKINNDSDDLFMSTQLLKIALHLDFQDEVGANKLSTLLCMYYYYYYI